MYAIPYCWSITWLQGNFLLKKNLAFLESEEQAFYSDNLKQRDKQMSN